MLDDGDNALLFQNYKMHLLHMHANARAIDSREMPLMPIVRDTLKYISVKALAKLKE
jgi:hypothetical protein